MSDQIDLRSSEFIDEARDWLNHANAKLASNAEEATALVRATLRKLEAIGEDRLDDLRSARAALAAVDEDEDGDSDSEQEQLDEALEAMQRYRRVAEELEAAGRRFIARASDLSERGRQVAHAGVAFLDQRLDALHEYQAVPLSQEMAMHGEAFPAASRSDASPTKPPPAVGPAASVAGDLPPGFTWLDIAEVDTHGGFIDDPAQFRKAGQAQMRRGLEILRDEIVPRIKSGEGFTREDAERIDLKGGTAYTSAGFIHPESRVTIWDAFLDSRRGADVVVVERGINGKMQVISGRHRLGLARQLGMQTIPVRLLGSGNGT